MGIIKQNKDGSFYVVVWFFFILKIKDIHIGYGGEIIRPIKFKTVEDYAKVIESLHPFQTIIDWKELLKLNISYQYN